jgi:hypothetical protein
MTWGWNMFYLRTYALSLYLFSKGPKLQLVTPNNLQALTYAVSKSLGFRLKLNPTKLT